MTEIRTGLRSVLARSAIYDLFQRMVGAYAWRARVIDNIIKPYIKTGFKIIDIGCGTCDVLRHLPDDIDYYGFDRNEAYISAARQRFFSRRATFECRSVADDPTADSATFDIALAFGLMHHLEDQEVAAMLRTARNLLASDGKLFLLDPVFTPEQSRLARFMVGRDRGRNVRTDEGYAVLCGQEFKFVSCEIDRDPLLIPYTGIVITCSMNPQKGPR